ncbi:hypothetical protein DFJ77DRAFT_288175 [Powellomyces hirtus]|nr:hypothetical protein DFJ77DRAFT_288175 [Powellomyces hirtus]
MLQSELPALAVSPSRRPSLRTLPAACGISIHGSGFPLSPLPCNIPFPFRSLSRFFRQTNTSHKRSSERCRLFQPYPTLFLPWVALQVLSSGNCARSLATPPNVTTLASSSISTLILLRVVSYVVEGNPSTLQYRTVNRIGMVECRGDCCGVCLRSLQGDAMVARDVVCEEPDQSLSFAALARSSISASSPHGGVAFLISVPVAPVSAPLTVGKMGGSICCA